MSKAAKTRDYYSELSRRIDVLWHNSGLSAANEASSIADRISWAYKWKKITHSQMSELADRMTEYFQICV